MKYDVCVVGGCGRVGLPLSIAFADKGLKVCIYDINEQAVATVNEGRMLFLEEGADAVLRRVAGKTLFATDDPQSMSDSRFVIVVIGTPVDEHLNPQFTLMKEFFETLLPHFRDDQIVILRSTVYPGTTRRVDEFLRARGLRVHTTFCPERIAQGHAMRELAELPQVVSGFEEGVIREVSELFRRLSTDIVVLAPEEAELAKLFTNTWRYLQFAAANQFYMIATDYGLDFYRILEAMKYKYPRADSFPGAGFAAGPCLFKDTMQVAAFNNNAFFLGHAAMLVNEGLPNFMVQRLKEKHSLKDKTVGILGMAFKANNDDRRESLAFKLRKILEMEATRVLCSDVYIQEQGFVSASTLLRESDVIILGAPHREYKHLDIDKSKTVVDIWNFWGKGGLF
jgi:UDP-N-acetyl-D-mannosaminuronic acid dehydrogenase